MNASELLQEMEDSSQDNSNSDDVECPKCGVSINKHGLGSHKNSKRCKVYQDRNEIKERNLIPAPNSKNIREFLEDSDHPIETMRYRYNGQQPRRFSNRDTVKTRKYTTEEGMKEAKQNILINPSDTGIRIEVSERLDGGIWLCTISSDHYDSELLFVDVDTDEDVSRRRVAYVHSDNGVAFTTDGDRIGDTYTPEDAKDHIGIDTHQIIARVV